MAVDQQERLKITSANPLNPTRRWRHYLVMGRLLLLLPLLSLLAIVYPLASRNHRKKLLSTPEDKIDIGLTALRLAKEFHPEIDIKGYDAKINALVENIRNEVAGSEDPILRLNAMRSILFSENGFAMDRISEPDMIFNPAFINKLLDSKLGNCMTLTTLYMAVAQRLGYPIHTVLIPGHLFMRYLAPNGAYINVDASMKGNQPRPNNRQFAAVSKTAVELGTYMRPMSVRETAGLVLTINGLEYQRRGEYDKAITYGEGAVELYPQCAPCYALLGHSHRFRSVLGDGPAGLRDDAASATFYAKAQELGYVAIDETEVWRERQMGAR